MNTAAAPARIASVSADAANLVPPYVASAPIGEIPLQPESKAAQESVAAAPARPVVLVATVDPDIRREIGCLLETYAIKTVWATSMEEVRSLLARETVAACFCGFWLVDGTYRDVVRQLKQQRIAVPAIIVCAPECPTEYRDYLEALKLRSFDFICHPYRHTDFERFLPFAAIQRTD
jgi:DNA-binding NtrC family response regulator